MLSIKKWLDRSIARFAIVGVVNTIVGTAIMLVCYNFLNVSYWWSSAANYFITSILSYYLNKKYTFNYGETDKRSVIRFILNIIICYAIAYGMAKPLIYKLFIATSKAMQENIALLTGTFLFIIINYLGQKFYAFSKRGEKSQIL